jgi:hypothetical protein
VTSVIGLNCLPWPISHGDYSPTAPAAPSLRPLVPSRSLYVLVGPGVSPSTSFPRAAGKSSESGRCCYISGVYSVCNFFFCFGRGPTPPQNSVTFRNPMEIPTTRFTTYSPKGCLTVLLNALLLPRRSCPSRHRSFMPFLHFGCSRSLFPNVHPFGVQHHPCMVPDDCVPCAVQERHGQPSVCGGRPNSPGTHHHPWAHFFDFRRRPPAR